MTPPFVDLAQLPEDDRIAVIAAAVRKGQTVGFFVDDDRKADRYLRKLGEKIGHRVVFRGPAPGPSILVKVGPIGH